MNRCHMFKRCLGVVMGCSLAAQAMVIIEGDLHGDYVTIQAAVDAAGDGATIRVSTNEYAEVLDIASKNNLTIEGKYNYDCTAKIAGSTVIYPPAPGVGAQVVWVEDSSVRLVDLEITGGRPSGGGAFMGGGMHIKAKSDVQLDGCRVFRNEANGFGGGIYVTNSSLMVTNSLIYSNRAFNASVGVYQPAGRGGGIAVNNGYLLIQGYGTGSSSNSIRSNWAADMGGGVYVDNKSWAVFSNETADVVFNSATNGGGIAVTGASRLEVHDGTDIAGNTALLDGGGIWMDGQSTGLFTGAQTWIGDNSAFLGPNVASNGHGGGLFVRNSLLTLRHSARVHHNRAAVRGGGLYLTNANGVIDGGYIGNPFNMAHTNSADLGGGIYAADSTLVLTNGAIVHGNTARNSGGGIAGARSTIVLDSSIIRHNQAVAGTGGGLDLGYYGTLQARNTAIYSNRCLLAGGGMRLLGLDTRLDGGGITNNVAGSSGGGVYVYTGNLSTTNGCNLYRNEAGKHGGGIALDSVSSAVLLGGYISQNRAATNGGGIFITNCAPALNSVDLEYNQADVGGSGAGRGGAIHVASGAVSLRSARDLTLLGDNRAAAGGALYAAPLTTVTVSKAQYVLLFFRNAAEYSGGALCADSAVVTITGAVQFLRNTAQENGGGVYVNKSTALISGGTLFGSADTNDANIAHGNGGGFAALSSDVTMSNVTFRNNVATNFSGGAEFERSALNGGELEFYGNRSARASGGGLGGYLSDGHVDELVCTWNEARQYGGGCSWENGALRLTNSRLGFNKASDGGGLSFFAATGYVNQVTVDSNQALEHGGGVSVLRNSMLAATNLNLWNNVADGNGDMSGDGGGMMVVDGSAAHLWTTSNGASRIRRNQGERGAGIFVTNAMIQLYGNIRVEENTAQNYGGGLFLDAAQADVRQVYFTRNVSSGVNAENGSDLAMIDSVVAESTMGAAYCAGVDVRNSVAEMHRCTIYSNLLEGVAVRPGATLTMSGSLVYYHADQNVTAGQDVDYSNIQGGYAGTGNFDAAPLLYAGNYHLTAWSPCRDQGPPATVERDVDGELRTGNMDIGFDEFVDGDGDGLPDLVETGTGIMDGDIDMGTDPANADSDDDGVPDGEEWLADTDPNEADSRLEFTAMTDEPTGVRAHWHGGVNAAQVVEYSTQYGEGGWTNWQFGVNYAPPTPEENSYLFITAPSNAVFRVRASRFGL